MHNFDVVYYFDILYRVLVCEFGCTLYVCIAPYHNKNILRRILTQSMSGYRFLPPRCPVSLGWSCMARCSFPRPWQESLHHHPKIWIRISYSGLVSGCSHQSLTCIHTFLYMVHTRLDQRQCVSAVLSVTLSGSWVQIPHKAVPETVCVSKNLI